ncbi:hypothetical protein [Umezawaea tangerina]|uniref:Uncharacterized protein n=1 Tax=Umezawaea tangerina TaxID=84725 RepID=A0A2T0SNY8_9PSEU|nr:hypothetical protein [Umezawaea tangerina]PRY35120.1 hypothetical protein CLV43_11438 [Umezawaea tangerina]
MDQLKFDPGLGTYVVNVAPDSVWISKGMGAHNLQLQLEVGIPEVGVEAGRLLSLETTLYALQSAGPSVPLGSANVSIPFTPNGETRRQPLQYLITNAQLLALEQSRAGDLRLELHVRGFLPQASGFPGGPVATEHISIAESRWRQQLAGLGRTLGVEMMIPFPADDEPVRGIAEFLREAQRLLCGNEIDSAMLQVRKALEAIKATSSWNWPGKKNKVDCTADERWALIRSALEDQASGAMHGDAGTKDYDYSRAEVEVLIAMTAALLRIVS